MPKRIPLLILLACASVSQLPARAEAQSVTLSGLSSNVEYAEAKDFFDEELMNRSDMLQTSDIGWQEGQTDGKIISPGTWQATNTVQGGYLFPLAPGFKDTLPAEAPQGNVNSPRIGYLHPIDASFYNYFCYQAKVTPSSFVVYWANDLTKPYLWPDGDNSGSSADYMYVNFNNGGFGPVARTSTEIRCFDMTNLGASFQSHKGSWSGMIHGLRLDPSLSAPPGATTTINWIRLASKTSAPTITFTWTRDQSNAGGAYILYADHSNTGRTGVPLAYFPTGSNPGSYTFPTAALPAGDWYFYIKSQPYNPDSTPAGGGVYSNYSARLRIRAHADFNFVSPSELSGTDYWARTGNPLDMSGPEDVPNLNTSVFPQVLRQFINPSFQSYVDALDGKIFQAMAEPANLYPGQAESDSQVWTPVAVNDPIDPRRHCHFGVRMAADMTQFPSHAKFVEEGGVARVAGWKTDLLGAESMDPGAFPIYPGWAEYVVNLCKLKSVVRGMLWKDISIVRNFRFDPLETGILNTGLYNWFYIDWFKLTEDNYAPNGSYQIQYTLSGGTGPFTVDFFRDTDQSGADGTFIGTANIPAGQLGTTYSLNWDTSGLADGSTYYVYAQINDGKNDNTVYSAEPVTIGSYHGSLPLSRVPAFDYDGDGKSDPAVLRRGSPAGRVCTRNSRTRRTTCRNVAAKPGLMYVNGSRNGLMTFGVPAGAATPVAIDVDGDGSTDFGTTMIGAGNVMHWNIRQSSTNTTYFRTFGIPGDVPAVGDWNGNQIEEIGVFRNGAWYILDENNVMIYVVWGQTGDINNQADFDGDRRTDLTVFRPSTGEWYVFRSKDGQVMSKQFGLPGDIPVAADYDGDGKADFAIYRPSSGLWVISPSAGGPEIVKQWGLASDIPKRGLDWDGDGKPELTVYRPSNGWWYVYNVVTGQTSAFQFGLPGDVTPPRG